MDINNATAQMRKGVLEFCILSILSRNDAYASDLIQELKSVDLIIVEGTLYPLLTRQKNAGLLSYRWEESVKGPPRKYYMLTQEGRDFLKELDMSWEKLTESVNEIRKAGRDINNGKSSENTL